MHAGLAAAEGIGRWRCRAGAGPGARVLSPAAPALRSSSRRSLEQRVGFIALFCLVLIVATVVWLALHERRRLTEVAEAETQTTAFFLADHASRLFESADFAIRQAAAAIEGRSWPEMQDEAALWEELHALADRLPYVEAIWLNDETGLLRLTTFEFPTPPSNAADRDFFTAHLEPGTELHVSEPIVGRVTARPTFLLSRRLETPTGAFRGIASVTADLDYFTGFYGSLQLPEETRVTLFRAADGAVVAQMPEPGLEQPFDRRDADRLAVALAAAPGAGTIEARGDGDDARLISYHKVSGVPLYVAVSVPRRTVDAVWLSEAQAYGLYGVAALLALALLTLFAFRQARQESAAKGELERRVEERTAALTAANGQLATLFQELHHRVKNNLQVVSSLLGLQRERVADPETRAVLQQSIDRVRAMGLVHELLYRTNRLSDVDLPAYLGALADSLAQVYGASPRIAVEVDAAPVRLDLEMAMPLALIVNEALSNAFKHAFPGDRGGRIRLGLGLEADGCALAMADDGIGLPPGFDWRQSRGLGWRIIRSLADQIGATVDVESDGGTRVVVRFAPRADPAAPASATR